MIGLYDIESHGEVSLPPSQKPVVSAWSGVLILEINEVWAAARVWYKVIICGKATCCGESEVEVAINMPVQPCHGVYCIVVLLLF